MVDWKDARKKLEAYKVPKLKEIAIKMGIEPNGLRRDKLIEAIMEGWKKKPEPMPRSKSMPSGSGSSKEVKKDHVLKPKSPAPPQAEAPQNLQKWCPECDGSRRRGLLFGIQGFGMFKGPNLCRVCGGTGRL